VRDRLDVESVERLHLLVTWGAAPRRDLLSVRPRPGTTVRALGNPRIDLLRSPLRELFAQEGRAHRERIGPYVLVNTNFDLVNHADGKDDLLERLRASGRVRDGADEQRFLEWAEFRGAIFAAFVAAIPELARQFPALTFVVRPHPSESLVPWRAIEQAHDNVVVTPPAGTVLPWIAGADAVLHNSCTTAIEAYVLDKPVIAFRPDLADANRMESALPNELSRCAATWEGVADLLRRATTGAAPDDDLRRRVVAARWMANLDGPLAAQRIADATEGLDHAAGVRIRRDAARRWRDSRPAGAVRRLRGRTGTAPARPATTADARQRFPGLTATEVDDRIRELCAHLEVDPPAVTTLGEDLFHVAAR
jgi:surface carbohydrate biosynthesis protein